MANYTLVRGGSSGIASKSVVDGQLLFDIESRVYYLDAIVNGNLTRVLMGEKPPFVGTQAQWDALTPVEKAYYADTFIYIVDDYIEKSDVMEPPTPTAPGKSGLVPVPQIGDENKVLTGSGTWVDMSTTDVSWTYDSSTETVTFNMSST